MSTFWSIDPESGTRLAQYASATADETATAVRRAAELFAQGALTDRRQREHLLRAAASRLAADDGLIELCRRETALSHDRLAAELARTCGQLSAFADVVRHGQDADAMIDRARPERIPAQPDIRRMLVPVGPVAVFEASNFPLAFGAAGGDTAAAVAAGCPVVVKGHPSHPGTSERVTTHLRDAAADSGVDGDVAVHLLSADHVVGEVLVDAPELAAVAFTGSRGGGESLFRRAAQRPVPIPVYAEMSGVNPVVVTARALARRGPEVADALAAAVVGSGGQLCTKPGLVAVPAGPHAHELAERLARRLAEAPATVLLNEAVDAQFRAALERLDADPRVRRSGTAGAAHGGERGVRPAVYVTTPGALDLVAHEVFGPVTVVVEHEDEQELVELLQQLDGQLTVTAHAEPEDADLVRRLAPLLRERAGRLLYGGVPTGVAVTHAMHHGGPWPATTVAAHTSVGMTSVHRFSRPVAYQGWPDHLLPAELRDSNPYGISRRIDGEAEASADAIAPCHAP